MGGGGKGGGGGGGGGDYTTTVRYAPYIEENHAAFLDAVQASRIAVIAAGSPFASYVAPEVEDAFFGDGYAIADFPALYDMFGKFMAGLDIEVLWTQLFTDTVEGPQVGALVAAESKILDDDIEANILPRFLTGMRDINAVMSSSFVIGKAIIEDAKVKSINKFAAELQYKLIGIAQDRWSRHLEWNKAVIASYGEVMKLYYATRIDTDTQNYAMKAKDALWPFTVYEYERAALGALQGATTTSKQSAGESSGGIQGALSGAMSGAAMGYMVGGSYGAAAGAIIGGVSGWLS